jgi:hypothetical protein
MDLRSGPTIDDARTDSEPSPGDVFVDVLQRNPEVCSNCWLKIRDVILPYSWKKEVRKGLVKFYTAKPDRTEPAKFPGESSRNPPKSCSNCGSIRGSTVRPLPKDRAIEYAWNLSETLCLLEVEHDPLVLAAVVARRKRFPRFGSTDDDNYRVAIEYALEHTDFSIEDVLEAGRTDPARLVRDEDDTSSGVSFKYDGPDRELPALPPG